MYADCATADAWVMCSGFAGSGSLVVVASVTPEAMSEFMSGSRVLIPMAVLMSAARVTTKVHVDANGQDYGLKPS